MGIVWLQITSLIYMSILLIIYFSSKRINSIETSIFKKIMIANWIGLIIELGCFFTVHNIAIIPFINYVVTHLLLIYYIIYILLFTYYLFIFSNSEKADDTYRKRIRIFCYIYFIVNFLCIVFLPLYYSLEPGKMYSYGPSVNFMYISYTILIFMWNICLIKNFKKLKFKKMLPIIILIFLGAVVGIVQRIYPELLLMTGADTIVTFIMYFTIENPDVKMIQELEVAREQADKANRAKTDFLSSMSHEIRTPLNAIVGFSDCIMDAQNLGEAKENAKDIVNASQTLLEIVNGILDISKIEAGKIEIVNSKYNAPETFLELAKLITPKMNEKGLDFSYNIASDLPDTLFGDHANLKKIVTNLLSNACKYTERGYVHYEVNCVKSNGVCKLIISVEDSGRGIKKENVDKMFTKFQRLDEDKNTTIEGTGLGLAITKQLIELMGGRIILHTVYGEGSKFTVVLNQKIEVADAVIAKKVKDTLDLNNVRIMLVDDTALNLKVATKLLEKYNANQIVTCSSGFECLDRIKRGEVYDLILLDDMMPKMSGVETLQQLKQIPGFNVPTVALTANAISGMREKYLRDGFDDYLAKPIEKDQLVMVVNQLLGRSATEDISTVEINKAAEDTNIRSEEIPKVEDMEKAEEARSDIIPVEENIEEVLGDQLDRNYDNTDTELKENVEVDHIEEVEQLEEEEVNPMDIKPIETIPVVDISSIETPEKVETGNYDRSYLESNGVDVNHALELLGDMDMYNMTISDFMKEVEEKWNRIVDYKNSNNMPDYAIEVHSLKSDCKYLGFMNLADVAYEHELKSKENDSNFVNENFGRLEEEYKKVLEIARTYAEHNPVE